MTNPLTPPPPIVTAEQWSDNAFQAHETADTPQPTSELSENGAEETNNNKDTLLPEQTAHLPDHELRASYAHTEEVFTTVLLRVDPSTMPNHT
jgi:hypothetical protein